MTPDPEFVEQITDHYHPQSVRYYPVLWQEWELDGWVAVVRCGGDPFLVGTDHGTLIRISNPVEFMNAKLDDAAEAVKAAGDALADLGAG